MSLDKDLSGIARFNGEDFHIWKWQIRALLMYKKLLGIVEGTDLESAATDKEAWKDRQYNAYSLLCNAVERKLLGSLIECTTAKQIWDTLLVTYEHKSSQDKHELQKKFFQATIQPGQSLTEYIASLNLILSELTAIGDSNFTDDSMISKLTSNLPEGFDHFTTAWESTPAADRTLSNLKLWLLKEEAKLKKRLTSEITSETKAFYTQRYPNSGSNGGRIPPRSGSYGPSNAGRGYQPTSKGYQPRTGDRYVPQTSFRDRQPPFPSSRSSLQNFHQKAIELQQLKQRTCYSNCNQPGHWWQECPILQPNSPNAFADTQRQGTFPRAHLVDAFSTNSASAHVSSPGHTVQLEEPPDALHQESIDFDLFQDSFDHLQLEDPCFNNAMYTDLGYDDHFPDNYISRAYMTITKPNLTTNLLDVWIADSGANMHMSHNLEWFSSYTPIPPTQTWPITAVAGLKTYVAGTGTIRFLVQLPNRTEIISLENVLHVPGLQCNLFSTTWMAKKHGFHFIGKTSSCKFTKEGVIYLTRRLQDDMYLLDFTVILPSVKACSAVSFGNIPPSQERKPLQTWHYRLAHIGFDMIKKMAKLGVVTGLQLTTQDPDHLCQGCQFGKHQRSSFPINHIRQKADAPGDLLHTDICGRMAIPSKGGSLYFIIYKDDATSYRFVFCVHRKSEALKCFQNVCKMIFHDTGRQVRAIRSDRGGEFANKAFDKYLSDNFIRREFTAPYTPEQNLVAERENRTIMEGVCSCLYQAQIHQSFWAEAVQYVVYTLNRTGTRLLGGFTPYEAYTGIIPSVSHMHPFGCPVYIHIPAPLRKKLDPKAQKGIFVSYSEETKGYRVWLPDKQQIVTTRDVTFDEASFLIQTFPPTVNTLPSLIPLPACLTASNSELEETVIPPPPPEPDPIPNIPLSQSVLLPPEQNLPSIASSSSTNPNPDSTPAMSRRQINPPSRYGDWYYSFSAVAGTLPSVSKTYKEALESPLAHKWKEACDDKFDSLLTNHTWRLTNLPAGRKAIKCKWVFALKTKPDGSLEHFKARLVAKGCSQIPGVDFKETYSPTVKYDSIRSILAIAAAKDLEMRQFDIKTAFLHGGLEEEIYMNQIQGYEDKQYPSAVYLLLKALYGLRQASRAWALKMTAFLKEFDLVQAPVDHCVYYSATNGVITIVTIFVDDGLICSTNLERIDSILRFMSDVFVTKVFEPEMYIGLHITRDRRNRTITIDQELYIQKKIIEQYGLSDAHAVSTPADPTSRLTAHSNSDQMNLEPTFPFSNMVGSIQFAALTTRCDISYATSAVATYKRQSAPTHAHCNAVKRIGRYLKGTKHLKLTLGGHSGTGVLTAYTDADYGSDPYDRKSRTGYVIFYNNGPVSWGSKKQTCVATSTTHAEYIALYTATKEVIWCRRLLAAVGEIQPGPTIVHSDSQSAMRLAINPEFHANTKHIDIKYHYTREEIVLHSIRLQYIHTTAQIADLLTKPLTPD
jgi:hypothetical protein